ncbi:uncharacterized protein [Amphiura filiformis]
MTEIQVEGEATELQPHQVLVPISGQETVIIATTEDGHEVPTTVSYQLAHAAAQQGYIQVPTSQSSEDVEATIQQVQIQEAELQPGETIQTVQLEAGETIQTVHFDGETVHIQGTDATIPVHIQPAETLQPVQIQSVHMGLTSSSGDHVVVPATETLQQVVHISSGQPAVMVQAERTSTETVNSAAPVPASYPTEPISTGWEHIFVENYTPYEGYVESLEEVHRLITAYEISTITKFVKTRCSGKLFGVVRFDKKCRIWWEDIRDTKGVELKYDGTPFIIMGSRVMSCIFGPDNNKNYKIRAQEERVRLSLSGIEDDRKRRQMKTPSKKVGCPAMISIRHIVRFPRHQIDTDDVTNRRQAASSLKEDFMDCVRLPYEERFYVCLPSPSIHAGHPEGEEALSKDSLDERIIAKIHELVAQGIEKPGDIEEHLNTFVTDELFKGSEPPPQTWRRFYPKKNDIRNQVYRAKGIKSGKPKDEVAMAIQAVGGIEDGTTESTTSEQANKPQLNRLRYQCRDKLKLLIDVTHICNCPRTLQAMLGVLNNLHSELWNELLSKRGDAPLKAEDVAAAAAAAAAAATSNASGDSQAPTISWPTTGLLNKPQKKRGRKRKEETCEDTTDPYARVYMSDSSARRKDNKPLEDRYRENQGKAKKAKKARAGGPKRGRGRPRKKPIPVMITSNTLSQPSDEMEIVTIDIRSSEDGPEIDEGGEEEQLLEVQEEISQ